MVALTVGDAVNYKADGVTLIDWSAFRTDLAPSITATGRSHAW